MKYTVNTLITWKTEGEGSKTERVLWMFEGWMYVIDIHSNGLPYLRNITDIEDGLSAGAAVINEDDPYMVIINEGDVPLKHKEKRDKAWEFIKGLVEDEPRIYQSRYRRQLIKEVTAKNSVSETGIIKYLKKYWRRGKTPNALLPDYNACGGRNKEKSAGDAKRGRPRKYKDVEGNGINVSEDIKKIFRIAVNRFYYTTAKNSLVLTYELMLKEYFSDRYKIENGIKVPLIKHQSEVPSFGQFTYWFNKERNIKKEITSRYSSKKYLKQYRAITGNVSDGVLQPGTFEIDCQIADVYLVSRYNRNWVIGRPAIYAVIDKFSRLICGIYIGLESGSYVGAMMALLNTATDKVAFCTQYGIEITEEDWPVHHLPEAVVADRGELISGNIDNLINTLNVKVRNTPSHRADLKSLVERFFGLTNERVKPFLPGVVNLDGHERGDPDYRTKAKLDLYQFTQVVIKSVLYHNNHYHLDNFKREEAMIQDSVPSVPIQLFRWGITNRGGALRSVAEDAVKLALMPSETAVVTAKGIKFKDMYYASTAMLKGENFIRARANGTWRIKISYDPRDLNYIYVHGDAPKDYEKCFLLDANSRYRDRMLEEIDYLLEVEKIQQKKVKDSVMQAKTELITEIQEIVKQAEKDFIQETETVESSRKRIKDIRENRKLEKELNRKNEVFDINENTNKAEKANSVKENTQDTNLYDGLQLLLKKQMEELHGNGDNS